MRRPGTPAEHADDATVASPRPTLPARLWPRRWELLVWLLVVGFGCLVLGPALLGRGVLLDVGLMRGMWPFTGFEVKGAAIPCRGDTVDFYMPGVANIRESLRHGELQTWSPYEVGGAPLASLPNHAVFSPMSWPYLVLPLWLAPAFVKLTELVVAVAGMTLFLGRLGVRRAAGMLAGVVFFASGFMIMWTNWPHTKVAALVPMLFWALDRVVTHRRPLDPVLVAVVVASMLLGGFPAVTMFALTFGALYVVVRGLQQGGPQRGRALLTGWAGAGAGVVLGVGLAAVQIVPFVKNISAIGYDDRVVTGPKPLGYLMTVIAPDSLGACVGWEQFGGPSNPIESTAFLGAAATVLALFAMTVTHRRGTAAPALLLSGLFVLATVLLWVGGPLLDLVQSLPGYDHNSIGRLTSIFGFLGAVLAGIGFDRLLDREADGPADREAGTSAGEVRRRTSWWRVALAVVVLGGTLVLFAVAFREAKGWATESGQAHEFLTRTALGVVLAALAALGLVVALAVRGRLRALGVLLVALLVVGQSTVFAHALLPLSEKRDFYPATPAHRFLQQHIGHDRYAGDRSWGYPATSDYYRLRTPVGHEFTDPDWKAVLARIDPQVQASPTYSAFSGSVVTGEVGRQPLLDQLAVRYWAAPPSLVAGGATPLPLASYPDRIRLRSGEQAGCTVRGGALRGVQVRLARRFVPAERRRTVLHTRVTTSSGVLEGEQALVRPVRKLTSLRIGVLGEDLVGRGPARVEVWTTGTRRDLVLVARGDEIGCSAVTPAAGDGLRLVFADRSALVYERASALPRIRWAGRSEVVADPDEQLDRLAAGIPDDTVLLGDGTAQDVPSNGSVDVLEDGPETIRLRVDADGPGHVVLADSIARPGWSARLDGREVPIVDANRALAAVAVGEGSHTLVLRYDAPGLRLGALTTLGSVAVALLLCGWHVLSARRRRRRLESPRRPLT